MKTTQNQEGKANPKATGSKGVANQMESQGTDTTSPLIEEMAVPSRGGKTFAEEKWPFSQLTPCTKMPDGTLKGPSFFIPEADNPDNQMAAARKRHKSASFITRKMTKDGVKGLRVWRGPDRV